MIKNCWLYILVSGCLAILSAQAYSQPKVRQLKISEGYLTHYYLYTYDANGKIIYERKQLENNGIRTNVEQTEWLTLGDTVALQRKWLWVDGAWKATHQIKSRYLDSRLLAEEHANLNNGQETVYRKMIRLTSVPEEEFYGLVGNELVLTQKTRTLAENANRKKVIQNYYSVGSVHSPTATTSTSYVMDSRGRIDSVLTEIAPPGMEPEKYLTRHFYRGNDTLPVSIQVRKWNPLAYVWENQSRTRYEYSGNGRLLEEVYEYFREMRWIATHRYVYSYYPEGVLQEKTIYGSIYRQWRKLSTISYDDVAEGFPRNVRSTFNFWGGTTGSDAITDIPFYFNGSQVLKRASSVGIEYLMPSKVDDVSVDDDVKVVLFPNPSDGLLFMTEPNRLIRMWEVYDMQGRRLLHYQPSFPVNRIDISILPAGMYLIRLLDSENQYHKQKITKY